MIDFFSVICKDFQDIFLSPYKPFIFYKPFIECRHLGIKGLLWSGDLRNLCIWDLLWSRDHHSRSGGHNSRSGVVFHQSQRIFRMVFFHVSYKIVLSAKFHRAFWAFDLILVMLWLNMSLKLIFAICCELTFFTSKVDHFTFCFDMPYQISLLWEIFVAIIASKSHLFHFVRVTSLVLE